MAGNAAQPVGYPLRLAAAACASLGDETASACHREALGAWIAAWRSHWSDAASAALGVAADAVAAAARTACPDPGRHLKLRRIAIARLADIP